MGGTTLYNVLRGYTTLEGIIADTTRRNVTGNRTAEQAQTHVSGNENEESDDSSDSETTTTGEAEPQGNNNRAEVVCFHLAVPSTSSPSSSTTDSNRSPNKNANTTSSCNSGLNATTNPNPFTTKRVLLTLTKREYERLYDLGSTRANWDAFWAEGVIGFSELKSSLKSWSGAMVKVKEPWKVKINPAIWTRVVEGAAGGDSED